MLNNNAKNKNIEKIHISHTNNDINLKIINIDYANKCIK